MATTERFEADGGRTARPARTLLYVEDNPSNLRLVERILQSQRPAIDLLTASSGESGLAAAGSGAPDAILLDLDLPDMSGEDVLRRLCADLRVGVPIAIVSADAMPATVDRMLGAGAAAYLTKPLDIAEFLDVVDGLLGGVPTRRCS